ncbi:MAG: hypothetical protein AAFP76_04585 [Bacteroidota bacterium]
MLQRLMNRFKFWLLGEDVKEAIDSNSLLSELEAYNKKLLDELEALEDMEEIMKKRSNEGEE